MSSDTIFGRQEQLLAVLERLLEHPVSAVDSTIQQAVQQSAEVLAADKLDIFFLDSINETLVAHHVSDTPMGRRQRAIGMDRLPLANGGRIVEVFLSGIPYFDNRVAEDPAELMGIKVGLGVQSQIATVFKVQTRHRGVILAASATPDFFSAQDVHFLEAIARWLGLAVGRAELTARMEHNESTVARRAAAEELLTIMTHELRNYLTPLRGRLDLLKERAVREGREKDVQNTESSIHTLNLLTRGISDLLDIARLNQGLFAINPQPMNLVEVVQSVVSSFAERHIPISIQAPREVVLNADPQRLQQALENMLTYVVNSVPRQTEITVNVFIEQRIDGPWVLLSVRMESSTLPLLSGNGQQPFVVSSYSTQLGVQLYLTNQIALAHHGTLTIHPQSDQETCLTFAIPVEEEELVVHDDDESTETM